jgi:hypothetical protein
VTEVLRIDDEHASRSDHQMVDICRRPRYSSVVKDHEAFARELVEVVPEPFFPFGSLTPGNRALAGRPDTDGNEDADQHCEEQTKLISQATAELWCHGFL